MTADRHAFFKFMVKSIAEKHGLRATFMPKPFPNLTGNGCHAHVSLWDKTGKNVFDDPKGELGLSALGYNFIGGIMHSAEALAAITNPTVNSYKRINAPPHHFRRDLVAQHHHLCRQQPHPHDPHPRCRPLRAPARRRRRQSVPAAGRRCSRRASTASRNKRDPGKRLDINMYTEGHTVERREAAAAQPARCAARIRALRRAARGLRRPSCELSQAQDGRLERLLAAISPSGSATRSIAEAAFPPGGSAARHKLNIIRAGEFFEKRCRPAPGCTDLPQGTPPNSSSAASGNAEQNDKPRSSSAGGGSGLPMTPAEAAHSRLS